MIVSETILLDEKTVQQRVEGLVFSAMVALVEKLEAEAGTGLSLSAQFGIPEEQKFPIAVDVKMSVNGVDVPVVAVLERWFQSYDKTVAEEADFLLQRKCSKLSTLLDEALVSAREAIGRPPYGE